MIFGSPCRNDRKYGSSPTRHSSSGGRQGVLLSAVRQRRRRYGVHLRRSRSRKSVGKQNQNAPAVQKRMAPPSIIAILCTRIIIARVFAFSTGQQERFVTEPDLYPLRVNRDRVERVVRTQRRGRSKVEKIVRSGSARRGKVSIVILLLLLLDGAGS